MMIKQINTFLIYGVICLVLFACQPSAPTSTATPFPTNTPILSPTPPPLSTVIPTLSPELEMPAQYTYEVIHSYPHDSGAFTQGLVFTESTIYEGTGLRGQSTLRKVDLTTGNVLQSVSMADQYFGEGIVVFGNQIIQLTWQSRTGFVYDKDSFELLRQFTYPTEGWGITHDGERLIMSDGTNNLYFWQPETLTEVGRIAVFDGETPITRLNELEYINGEVWANVWQTNQIARIDPTTGQVTGWVDLTGLLPAYPAPADVDVLNGIAYDATNDRLFVTGKLWPRLFEIKVVPVS